MAANKLRILGILVAGLILMVLLLGRGCGAGGPQGLMSAVPASSALFFLVDDAGVLLNGEGLFPSELSPSLEADLEVLREVWLLLDSLAPGRSWPAALHYQGAGPEGPALGAVFAIGSAVVDPAALLHGAPIRRTEYRRHSVFSGQRSGQPLVVARSGGLLLVGRFPFLVEEGIGQLARGRKPEMPPVISGEPAAIQVFARQEKLGELFGGPFADGPFLPGGWWRLLVKSERGGTSLRGRFWADDGRVAASWFTTAPAGPVLEVIPESPALLTWTTIAAGGSRGGGPALLDSIASGELALAVPVVGGSWQESDRLAVIGINARDSSRALEALALRTGLLEQFDYQTYPVSRLLTGLPPISALAGTAYTFQNPYVVQLGDYLVFSGSRSALELWIDHQVVGATLSRSAAFLEFLAQNEDAAGAFLYGDPLSIGLMLDDTPPGRWLAGMLSGFKAFGGFFTRQGKGLTGEGFWPRDTTLAAVNSEFLWRRRLGADVGSTPQAVQWADDQVSIAVSDRQGDFYLLDSRGELLWTYRLDGPLRSSVVLIDYYGNGEQQLLFNTISSVYLLDREGRPVGSYPFQLQSPALTGLTLADFSGRGDYGIFIPCANGSIFGFDERQLPLPGWNPGDSIGAPAGSLLHFQFDNKDFVVALGVDGILRIYDRNGRLRAVPDTLGAAAVSPPAVELRDKRAVIVVADQTGGVLLHRPGHNSSRLRLRSQGNPMWFALEDVAGDARQDYIALTGRRLTVHTYVGGRLKKATDKRLDIFPDTLFTLPIPGSEMQGIGLLARRSHQILLVDGEGRPLPGFPLAGSTAFAVVDLFGDGRRAVLVGEGDNVYVYLLPLAPY